MAVKKYLHKAIIYFQFRVENQWTNNIVANSVTRSVLNHIVLDKIITNATIIALMGRR